MEKAMGGKNLFGHFIGILMLESQFPRIPCDIGNATTWDFPVLYKVIEKTTPDDAGHYGLSGGGQEGFSSLITIKGSGSGIIWFFHGWG